jgi:serine/threonine protein kinase
VVALKVLSPQGGPVDALLNEARAAAALNHPNVCTLHSIDTRYGVEMIVMEYVDGRSLAAILEAGPVSAERAAAIGAQVANAMSAAHAAGIVHGDLKPANLIITDDGQVKVMDFGMARRIAPDRWHAETLDTSLGEGSGLSGTPGYMSPEVSRGETAGPASDVFALGLIMAEMLTGEPIIRGRNIFEVLRFIDKFEPADLANRFVDPFGELFRESLQNDPASRTISMDQIRQRLSHSLK